VEEYFLWKDSLMREAKVLALVLLIGEVIMWNDIVLLVLKEH